MACGERDEGEAVPVVQAAGGEERGVQPHDVPLRAPVVLAVHGGLRGRALFGGGAVRGAAVRGWGHVGGGQEPATGAHAAAAAAPVGGDPTGAAGAAVGGDSARAAGE